MEMAYVLRKNFSKYPTWTEHQAQEFNRKFTKNMIQCSTNPRFCKDLVLYEEATIRKKNSLPPQTKQDIKLNNIIKELELIEQACLPFRVDNREVMYQQANTRLKYEKALRANKEKKENIIRHSNKEK